MFIAIQKAICIVLTAIAIFVGGVFRINDGTTVEEYETRVDSLEFFENTRETAIPQTSVYNTVLTHLSGEKTDGKDKKAIVIGYDGCRLDMFTYIDGEHPSGITDFLDTGSKAYISYAGAVNYPQVNRQMTSTAPGWCSMLTGVWSVDHGVFFNYTPKLSCRKTLLTTAVEDGIIDSSAFYVSWNGHFGTPISTYTSEKKYIEKNGLNVNFLQADDDDGTEANVMADLAREDCSDFIFLTLEYTDHCGHSTGFTYNDKRYIKAFYDAEAAGARILDAVLSRENFENEDWLIIMTTDHGGINLHHGFCSEMERMTYLICNKEVIVAE